MSAGDAAATAAGGGLSCDGRRRFQRRGLELSAGRGDGSGGDVHVHSGGSVAAASGSVHLGSGVGSSSGDVLLETGQTAGGDSGTLVFGTGSSETGTGGGIAIVPGSSAQAGSVQLTAGDLRARMAEV